MKAWTYLAIVALELGSLALGVNDRGVESALLVIAVGIAFLLAELEWRRP